MHELAIAQRLIDTACAALPSTDLGPIKTVKVQLCALAGLSKDELVFGFQVVATGTPFAAAALEIEELPAIIHCPHCNKNHSVSELVTFYCPVCDRADVQVDQGKELTLRSIEMRDVAV